MRFRIRHTTRFVYERAARDSHNEIHLKPRDSELQRCLHFDLIIEPSAAVLAYTDFFENDAHSVSVSAAHEQLVITADSTVERSPATMEIAEYVPFVRFLVNDERRTRDHFEFLTASPYIPFSKRLRKFFWQKHPLEHEDVADYTARTVSLVRGQFEYETHTTHVHSRIDDILKAGGGVCQDFAHLTIGMLRLAGVPSRYVSGYLAPRPGSGITEGAQASHAWLEAWLPNLGWTGFDPTHNCRTDERYIQVAVGRDYGDVPPIRGHYKGASGNNMMTVELDIAPDPGAVTSFCGQNQ
jgi:transglutaminase-like putative cysteine protease